jgi:secondary thiamine-phosphate synthase enzyme
MRQEFEVRTPSHACLVDITAQVSRLVSLSNVKDGICHVFVPHTTAGITINENADPTVQSDILHQLDKIAPWNNNYEHNEGNAAAHIKAGIVGTSQMIFVGAGRLQLGTWQGIYLAEFDGPRARRVWVKIVPG